ncbi:MAG: VOC family protein [Patescibacteria group bacterium]
MRHVALRVLNMERSRSFYERFFGMNVAWEPDPGHVYLTNGSDILALHQIPDVFTVSKGMLDHFGFVVEGIAEVDQMAQRAKENGLSILKGPKHHRDGSYSFYMPDPDGNVIQILYEPHISPSLCGEDYFKNKMEEMRNE